jgi:outer membrane protein OmpA-like peptidoglycan-associated protein
MAARRTTSIALVFPLVLAVGCGGAASPPPTPSTPETPAPAAPSADKPTPATNDTPAAKPAEEPRAEAPPEKPAEPEPEAAAPKKPAISCEPKPGAKSTKAPKLELAVDRAKVDLDAHKLEVKLTRAACKVELKVIGESGKILAEEAQAFNGAPAGTTLSVSWSPARTEAVMRIEVWGHDTEGNFVGVALSPWSVALAHEEVNFENDSDAIRTSEAPKLEASLGEINKILGKVQDKKPSLFIKGHTDTVGSPEHNLELSRRRAKSIAAWLRGHGLKIPIAYEGFGEFTPLVKTPDETAEPKNRRIDYFLSFDPPALPSGSVSFSWKGL